jgi:hypothetical protein
MRDVRPHADLGPVSAPAETDPLIGVLDRAARVDGPVRLLASRARPTEPALLPHARGENAALLDELLGTLLEELPRPRNQPRRVVLTATGVRFVVEHRPPEQRVGLVRIAAPFYRDRLLRAWKSVASPSELQLVRAAVSEVYGDLFELRSTEPGSDPAALRRAMARELVTSWRRADHPDVRRALAQVMVRFGLRSVGVAGEPVVFSGRDHTSDAALFPGDPAVVVEPGWAFAEGGEIELLAKVTVRSAD